MRIVFVADDIDAVGGIQTTIHTVAQHLARRGHHVHLVGLYRNPTPAAPTERPTYRRSVLDAPPPGSPTDPAGLRAAQQRMRAVLAGVEPGVLVMSSVHVSLWLKDVDVAGYRRIGHYHGSYEYARTHYHLGVIRDLWSEFDAAVFLSNEDATSFSTAATLRATWIPNPLPGTASPPQIPPAPATPPRVLAVGRLASIKRFELAIHAFAQAAVPGWHLHLIGDGEQEQALRQAAEERFPWRPFGTGAEEPVVFRGRLPAHAMATEYAAAQLLVMTSEHEGFGMVLAEAAAAGTPAIAFNVSGGVRSLIRHQHTGILVAPGDLSGLTDGLRALMTDSRRRRELGDAARAATAWLHPETVTDRWEQLLTEILRDSRQEARS